MVWFCPTQSASGKLSIGSRGDQVARGQDRNAGHEDVVDADRFTQRLFVRGGVGDGIRLHDDHVRHGPGSDHAASSQPEPGGRGGGQMLRCICP